MHKLVREAVIWLTGRDLFWKPKRIRTDLSKDCISFCDNQPPVCWKFTFAGNSFVAYVHAGPNFFHRWMQRLAFGFRWERHH